MMFDNLRPLSADNIQMLRDAGIPIELVAAQDLILTSQPVMRLDPPPAPVPPPAPPQPPAAALQPPREPPVKAVAAYGKARVRRSRQSYV